MKMNFFKKEKDWKKEKENFWLNINLYWKLSACFMFVVFVLSLFFGYVSFTKISKEFVLSPGDVSSQIKMVKKERIKKVLDYFSLREQKSKEILNSPTPVVDPSL